jgi:alkylation response protein AidB-like acyl-CoA dehydrogenase
MVLRAAAAHDPGEEAGAYANAAKYCAAEAGFRACETAVMTHGGMGYAREYHVERYFREIQIARIAPGQSPIDSVAHRRTRARPAEIVLTQTAIADHWLRR